MKVQKKNKLFIFQEIEAVENFSIFIKVMAEN
jgi:hypothetical protein